MKLPSLAPLMLAAAVAAATPLVSSAQTTMPANDAPPALPAPLTQPGGRTFENVIADLNATNGQLQQTLSGPDQLLSAEGRAANKDQVVPLLKRMDALLTEAVPLAPDPETAGKIKSGRYSFLAMLSGYGDADAKQQLAADDSTAAKSAAALGQFIAADDVAAKKAAVATLSTVADAAPADAAVLDTAMGMLQFAEDGGVTREIKAVVTGKLKGELAEQVGQQIAAQDQARAVFRDSLVGKPLTALDGAAKLDGGKLAMADLKGKVTLVDFWATWCAPCLAAMPKLVDARRQYGEKGFEIVGVSLDLSAEPLKEYLGKHPDVSWPMAYDAAKPETTQALADDLGILAYPTTLLLDRDGIVRGVVAGPEDELEPLLAMIPALLDKPATRPAE